MMPPDPEEELPPTPRFASIAASILGRDNAAWVYRCLLIAIIASLWLASDKHNDDRYVKQDAYKLDQESARKDAARTASDLSQMQQRRDADHELLSDMRNDVKWIKEYQQQHK
jgi:hypothetical protein